MLRILENGPGSGTCARFLPPMKVSEALSIVRDEVELLARWPILVIPQAGVERYRVDMLVVAKGRTARPGWHGAGSYAFLVECDGEEFHAGRAQADLARQRDIRRETGLDCLRFSGAEINFRSHQVHQVLAARVEAMHALQEFGEDVRDAAERVFAYVGTVSCHPALRTQYQVRNRSAAPDPYDEADPMGDDYNAARDLEWDPFEAMRDAVARLRHAVARLRMSGLNWEDEHICPTQGFRSIAEIVRGILSAR